MAHVIVNDSDDLIVEGRLSLSRKLVDDQIVTEGRFATHYYFEEIEQLETTRYLINNVQVFQEDFGTEDFDIVYSFVGELEVKGGLYIKKDEEKINKKHLELYDEEGGYKNE